MTTANVSTTSPGSTPFTVNVTVCNLLTDLTVKDFQIFVGGTFNCEGSACTNWAKTTATQLTYSGTIIANGTSIQVRRKTPNSIVQLISFASRFSSALWNSEIDRIIRWREEADLNGVGAGATITVALPNDGAYPTGWDGDIIQPPTRNATFDALQLFAKIDAPVLTGDARAPTPPDADNDTSIATTAWGQTRVSNALSGSPALGGNPTATTQAANTNNTRIATTAFVHQEMKGALDWTDTTEIVATGRYKNALINGRFDVWQRNTTFTWDNTTTTIYTADKWLAQNSNGGGTSAATSVTRQAFSPGQTSVPNDPAFFWRVTNSTQGTSLGAASFHSLKNHMENVHLFAGEQVTLSFWARSTITSKTLGMYLWQYFGTGGSPSANVTGIGGQTFSLSTTWTKFTATISVNSISGKTIGTSGNQTSALILEFFFQAGSNFSATLGSTFGWQGTGDIEIAQVQLERGAFATAPAIREPALELKLSQRYYQKSYDTITFAGATAFNGMTFAEYGAVQTGRFGLSTRFNLPMRITPTITLYDDVGNAGKTYRAGSNKASNTTDQTCTSGFHVFTDDATSSLTFGYHWTADADY